MPTKLRSLVQRPHVVFLLLSLILGTAAIFILPPSIQPDEDAHIRRAFEWSQGVVNGSADMPTDFSVFRRHWLEVTMVKPIQDPYIPVARNYTVPMALSGEIGRHIDIKKTPSNPPPNKSRYVTYTPLPYLTVIPLAWLAWWDGIEPFTILLLMRASILLTSTLMMAYAIKISPILKWQLLLVAMFTSTFICRSFVNADGLTIGYTYLFIALMLRTICSDGPITGKTIALLTLLSTLMCLSKTAYLVLPGLFFLLPRPRFGSASRYLTAASGIMLVPGILAMLWMGYASGFDLLAHSGFDENVHWRGQALFTLARPLEFLHAVYRSWHSMGWFYVYDMVGGTLENYLPELPSAACYMLFAMLILLPPGNAIARVKPWQKILSLMLFAVSCLFICWLMYIYWTPIAGRSVHGLHGRYFAPLMPLLLLGVPHYRWRYSFAPYAIALLISTGLIVMSLADIIRFPY